MTSLAIRRLSRAFRVPKTFAGRSLPFLAAAFLLTAAFPFTTRAEEWTKTYSISGRPTVRLSTNDGAVRVFTSDTKQVELRVEYHGYELNKDLRIDSRQDGNRVELDARLNSRWCLFCVNVGRTLRIEVRMPRAADLTVDTGDGSVESEAIEGNLDIHTGDGRIGVRGAKGSIRLRTGDGSIEAHDLDGTVDATTGDGHISMDGRFEVLNIKTGDGSIDARVHRGSRMTSPWSIRTGDGSVELALPEGFQADLDASTRDGHVNVAFPITVEGGISGSHIHGKLNGGGQPLSVHTGDGSIRLRRA
jgi:DUF4097 and DUF4098 domain-containing protein YvlB